MPLFYFTDAAILKQYDSSNVIESAVLTPVSYTHLTLPTIYSV